MAKKTKRKYKHITATMLGEMKERYIKEQEELEKSASTNGEIAEGKKGTLFLGSLWIGDFIRFVLEHKNDEMDTVRENTGVDDTKA